MRTFKKDSLAGTFEIINVVRRSLSYIDARLVDHGERVAFIAGEIIRCFPDSDFDPATLFVLCALHDIGAYKTEEIDNMVSFETCDVTNHAIYGYLFLKNTSHLGKYADAILYHHLEHDRIQQLDCPHRHYAELIFLADRLDILLSENDCDIVESLLEQTPGRFNPEYVKMFLCAERKYDISARLLSGEYRRAVDDLVNALSFGKDEILEYLKMLVHAIDFRSPFTVTHTASTTAISVKLGKLMKLSHEQLHELYFGAYLHDIGKVSVPVDILEKPAKLTDEEMLIIREHVVKTEEILRGVIDDSICDIASRHHEKPNGLGYPHGLSSDELTLLQRIVAVADVLSALISRRSYKEPFSKETTIDIMTKMCDGNELCPEVCNMLFESYDEIIADLQENLQPIVSMYDGMRREYLALQQSFPIISQNAGFAMQ